MCVSSMPGTYEALLAQSTTERFFPTHGWIPCAGIDAVVFQMFVRNRTGFFQARPAIQFAAARTAAPGAAAGVGTAQATDGVFRFGTTPATTNEFYARFGLMASLSQGTAEAYAEVALVPTFHDCGQTLAQRTLVLNPGDAHTSEVAWFAVSDLLPTVGIDKAKLAITFERNANADLEYIEGCRIFKVDGEPGTWTEMQGATWTTPATGNSDRNTGLLTFPTAVGVANQVFVQLGIGVRKKQATNLRTIARVQPAVLY